MAEKTSRAHLSVKRVQIDKSQSRMLVAAAIAAFMLTFALVGGKMLVGQIVYQNKVISAKKDAVRQMKSNIQASSSLMTSYKAFVSTSKNAIGGNPQGAGPQDGDNAKIVLDALPSRYDFPALTTSLERLLNAQNMTIESISGSDDEVNQQENESSPSPEAVPVPFQISANGAYASAQSLFDSFDKSIRPLQVQKVQLSGGQNQMFVKIDAQTYYQPGKNFNITKKDVK